MNDTPTVQQLLAGASLSWNGEAAGLMYLPMSSVERVLNEDTDRRWREIKPGALAGARVIVHG